MRTIGIDLAVPAAHKAVVVNDTGQYVSPVLSFRSSWEEISYRVARLEKASKPTIHSRRLWSRLAWPGSAPWCR